MYTAEDLLTDPLLYMESQLRIKPKVGGMIDFRLNKAQHYIHERMEDQKKRTGKVRVIILKGRQQGASTYVGARYFTSTVSHPGILTFIFAHDSEASSSLYGMVENFYNEAYDPKFLPALGACNAKELLFPGIKSGYKVGTAGTKGLGRSKTLQQVHWSEVAYSPNCDDHAAGILQAVPNEPDTEIVLESTANGQGDFFHLMCMNAMSGVGDFEMIFVPWYWQGEYTRELPEDFELRRGDNQDIFPSEEEYYNTFKDDGLTLEHLYWRRCKIESDFKGDVLRFMHEYPFSPQEAFEVTSEESFINSMLITRSIKTDPIHSNAPLIIGVDPARTGKDAFMLTFRKGRNITEVKKYPKDRLDNNAKLLAQDIDKYKPMLVNIDAGGLGVGLYDMMVDYGYSRVVKKVNFGGSSSNKDKYYNNTAEWFAAAREWFEDEPSSMGAVTKAYSLAIQSELSARKYEYRRNTILKMQSKDEFKKEYKYSPDAADSFLLTFANHVSRDGNNSKMLEQTYIPDNEWSPF